ncbi:molybdopterin-synthase adenylyltransferase MoeB [Kangiella sp. TOML190]|uniref:HesA/MoeB/ThiF family protein n=1 Tax=Kangiella sp. TOML190 TaxID=2931351 RepID=UPI00203B8A00|nr:molybdopterin-synthase adenylyltransferase MoeB [Kangiella sp. TOML190]
MFSEQELRQYSRHIALEEIDLEGQQKLAHAKVMIIGLGGLGSAASIYLAASGIGKLTLVDHDTVALSNLQRQILHSNKTLYTAKTESAQEHLALLNCNIAIETINEKLAGEKLDTLIGAHDLVLDCSDNFSTRYAINASCVKHQTPLISGAAIRWQGQVAVFNQNPQAPCYACLYKTQATTEDDCWQQGVLSPLVGVIGSLQAAETIKLLCGIEQPTQDLTLFDAKKLSFKAIKIAKDPNCEICCAN